MLSRLCRSVDVAKIRLQMVRARGPGRAFHSLVVLSRKLCFYCWFSAERRRGRGILCGQRKVRRNLIF